jgi:hypothetical protein
MRIMSDPIPPSPPSEDPQPEKPADEKSSDCFAPPKKPCECYCLHCHRVFMSDGIWFQKIINSQDGFDGFWMCPTPNCDGAGFTFDIFPTDPSHPANDGWSDDDGDEEFFEDDDEDENHPTEEYDPTEPKYAELDEQFGDDDDDDIEGEEWKHGLAPGERPPEPPWVAEARQRWEEEQKRYDSPDERPRVVDWSDRPKSPPRPMGPPRPPGPDGEISEDDIPF